MQFINLITNIIKNWIIKSVSLLTVYGQSCIFVLFFYLELTFLTITARTTVPEMVYYVISPLTYLLISFCFPQLKLWGSKQMSTRLKQNKNDKFFIGVYYLKFTLRVTGEKTLWKIVDHFHFQTVWPMPLFKL